MNFIQRLSKGHRDESQAGAWGILKRKCSCTVSNLLFLKDIKGFTNRKLLIEKEDKAVLIETRIEDDKIFVNELKGIEAVKTIYREKKRAIRTVKKIDLKQFRGWVYGLNVQIKNKSGKVTQIRQYGCDLKGDKKTLEKVIKTD